MLIILYSTISSTILNVIKSYEDILVSPADWAACQNGVHLRKVFKAMGNAYKTRSNQIHIQYTDFVTMNVLI